ncbi:hypothetical protein FAVG1_00322 [Fusarium avenaceum]|nr:hypothetical protein FAVG1_00322 [Fusarium avenaceum]
MVPSTNSGMFHALDEFLGRFHCQEPGRRKYRQRPLFGHIYMPSYRLEGVSIVEHIRQSFEETAPLFFVTSKQEKQFGSGLQTDCQVPPVTMLYQELLQVLTKDMLPSPYPDRKQHWHFLPGAHNEHGGLPLTVVVVLQLDPTVPADCALSLACLVEWALAASDFMPSHIRVLTMSAGENVDFLSPLVASSSQPSIPVTTVDLDVHGHSDSFYSCLVSDGKDDEGIAAEILEEIRHSPEAKRIVVSFNPGFAESLESLLGNAEADLVEQISVDDDTDMKHLKMLSVWPVSKPVVVTIRGQIPFLPPPLTAFDHIHIVLGYSDDSTPAWDNHTCQVVSYPHHLSKQHRARQSWWAYQTHMATVTIHPGRGGIDAFNGDQFASIRMVESEQLGGFIAAAADLTAWGFDADNVVGCFVRYPSLVDEMKSRLATQRLVVRNRIILSEMDADVFRAVLPHVKYDHRVALLLALESRPDVYRVKAQLAAFLTFDNWSRYARLEMDDMSDVVFQELWGLGKSLAPSGDMWLFLGLHKAYRKIIEDHGMYEDQHDKLKGIVKVSKNVARDIKELYTTLTSLILAAGCRINAEDKYSTETEDLSKDCQRELQSHLFRAYMHQVSVCYWPKVNGEEDTSGSVHFELLSTKAECQVSRDPNRATSLVKIVSLLDAEEGGYLFGISHQFFKDRDSSLLMAEDWTQIPKEILALWEESLGGETSIFQVLYSTVQHRDLNSIEL